METDKNINYKKNLKQEEKFLIKNTITKLNLILFIISKEKPEKAEKIKPIIKKLEEELRPLT
jgi:hypothetical protein